MSAPFLAAACADAYVSSGPSPTRAPTVHLLGAGQVGRAFLTLLGGGPLRLVGASDSTGSVLSRDGLDAATIARHKSTGLPLARHAAAVSVDALVAVQASGARLVADALPTRPDAADAAAVRLGRLLDAGRSVALASKCALGADPERFFHPAYATRIGCNATLGGTGASLQAELPELRAEAVGIAIAANASTTAILTALEAGASLDSAIADAQARGVLEPDPTLDLDGSDAAVKLAVVAGALSRRRLPLGDIPRVDVRALDLDLLRWRARNGRTTRLVGRWSPADGARLAYEEVRRTHPLATPPDRVVYTYALRDGRTRVHVGAGLGPVRTAKALLTDVIRLAGGAS